MKLLRILTIVAFAGGLANAQLPPAVPGGVPTFAGNAQHTGVFHPAATDLNVIRWSTTVDRRATFSNSYPARSGSGSGCLARAKRCKC